MLTDECQYCGAVDGPKACVEDCVCGTCRTERLAAEYEAARDRWFDILIDGARGT